LTRRLKPKNKTKALRYNLSVDTVIDISLLNNNSHQYVGNKAGNFRLLQELGIKNGFKTPENAFTIPFRFYLNHVNNSKAQAHIEELLQNGDSKMTKSKLRTTLQNIRDAIIEAPLDNDLRCEIENRMNRNQQFSRYRFRSSTNAEDAKGFSGAGLYDSYTGIVGDEKRSVEDAVKKVWASLWNYRAYLEREIFDINHREVFMGILVHRSFPNEAVNGVAITKNLYRKSQPGFVINAQKGDESVVNPTPGITCDQYICYPNNTDFLYENMGITDIISQSNLSVDGLLLSTDEIQNLADQLDEVKRLFYKKWKIRKVYLDFGVDVEFKIDGSDRQLYIKQARPYAD